LVCSRVYFPQEISLEILPEKTEKEENFGENIN
jgi:hypothetical protein